LFSSLPCSSADEKYVVETKAEVRVIPAAAAAAANAAVTRE